MKRRQLFVIATAIALGIACAAFYTQLNPTAKKRKIVSAQTVEPTEDFYYYVNGKAKPLTLKTDKIAVRFNRGVAESNQAATLMRETALAPDVDWRIANEGLDISLVAVKNPHNKSGVQSAIRNLRKASNVHWASPILETRPGFSHIFSDEFYISMPETTPEKDVAKLCKSMGVEIVRRVDLSPIQRTGFWLRVTKKAALNSLDMANYFFEKGNLGIYSAHPRFGYLYPLLASDDPNDDLYDEDDPAPGQWYLDRIKMKEAWDISTGNPNIVVAVLDTGVDLHYGTSNAGHEDLNSNQWTNLAEINGTAGVNDDANGQIDDYYGWNFLDPDPSLFPSDLPMDDFGHGTRSAGVIAAVTNNDTGVAGIAGGWNGSPAGCKIMPIRLIDFKTNHAERDDFVTFPRVADAIEYATRSGANVINMSFGIEAEMGAAADLIAYARVMGVVLVAVAHNYDESNVTEPGSHPGVICVGGANEHVEYVNGVETYKPQRKFGRLTSNITNPEDYPEYNPADGGRINPWGSNWGWELDIMAPALRYSATGRTIFTENPDTGLWDVEFPLNSYGTYNKTSSAAPQVAGVVALMQSAMLDRGLPLLSPAEVQAILVHTATDMNYTRALEVGLEVAGEGRDIYTGYGVLNAKAALELAIKPRPFIVRDAYNKHVMSVDDNGNFIAEGLVYSYSNTAGYTGLMFNKNLGRPIFTYNSPSGFIWVTTQLGGYRDLFFSYIVKITGEVFEEQSSFSPGKGDLVFRNSKGEIVAVFDSEGNIKIRGRLFNGIDPDPDARV